MPMLRLLPPLHDPQMMDIIAVHLLRDPSLEGKDREAECVKVIFSLKGSHTYIFFPIFWFGVPSLTRHVIRFLTGRVSRPRLGHKPPHFRSRSTSCFSPLSLPPQSPLMATLLIVNTPVCGVKLLLTMRAPIFTNCPHNAHGTIGPPPAR